MRHTTNPFSILALLFALCAFAPCALNAQDTEGQTYYVEDEAPVIEDWEIKIVWYDARTGKKQRTRGWLMLALEDRIMVFERTPNNRTSKKTIYVDDIVKVKYKPAYNELPDILLGAADGALGGGFVPVTTGNVYLDLLSGAVQGVVGGLINNAGNSTTVFVDGDSKVYLRAVYPELSGTQ